MAFRFSYLILLLCVSFSVCAAYIICPENGMIANFNQDVEDEGGQKCIFVAKNVTWPDNFTRSEIEDHCKKYGGPTAKLVHPENPVENEIARMVVNEYAGPKKMLIGIHVTKVSEGYSIVFSGVKEEVHEHYYDSKKDRNDRYENIVGEAGVIDETKYSYFLQENTVDLEKFLGVTKELCTIMNTEKGQWEITVCSELQQDFKKAVLCQSTVFKECDIIPTSCSFNEAVKACTQFATKNCPPSFPQEIYCDCPDTVGRKCEYSEWSVWSDCVGNCANRTKIRFRVGLGLTKSKSSECKKEEYDYQNCSEGGCSVCKVGDWEDWDPPCPKTCSDIPVYTNRNRIAIYYDGFDSMTDVECMNMKTESRVCNLSLCNVDCLQEVSEWEPCNATCGLRGTQTRTIKPIQQKIGNGLDCNDDSTNQSCPNTPCPIDCVYSDWIETECSATCGSGTITRTRTIAVHGAHSGKSCTDSLNQTVECFRDPCIVNCTESEWDAWGPCSVTCGGLGNRTRFKSKTVVENAWGYCSNTNVTLDCGMMPACPSRNASVSEEPEVEGMSNEAVVIFTVSGIIAVIILVVLFAGAYFYVRRARKKTAKIYSHELMAQAMQDVLGQQVKTKEKKAGDKSASVVKEQDSGTQKKQKKA